MVDFHIENDNSKDARRLGGKGFVIKPGVMLGLGVSLLLLTQCQCVKCCMDFLRLHSSKGTESRISGTLPVRALTFQDFVRANEDRGLDQDLLTRRFRVADANADGLLTAREIAEHQEAVRLRRQQEEMPPALPQG